MIETRALEKTLHLLAKRVKPKFNFVDDEQWYSTFGDMEGNGYYKCLICDHVIFSNDVDPNYGELDDHGIFHIKDANLAVFL